VRGNARLERDPRVAVLVQPTVALPTLELHDALNSLTVDQDALAAELSPDHAIAKVRLLCDDVLDALRQYLIQFHQPFLTLVIRGAPGHA